MRRENSSSKSGRGLKEQIRRQRTKALYGRLAASFWLENSPEKLPAYELLDRATNYIQQLRNSINELKTRKDSLELPVVVAVNERDMEAILEVNIVCGSENKDLKMDQVFRILEEEGAEIVSASNFTVVHKIYHTILWKAFSPRLGIDTKQVQERLKNIVSGT